jgi:hypothetical protein
MQRNDDHRQGRSLFLQTMRDVIAASKSLTNDDDGSSSSNDNDEATRLVNCARIRVDGSIISSSNNDGEVGGKRFSTAFCLPPSSSSRVVGGIGNKRQMKTVAQLSAIHLVGHGKAAAAPKNKNPSNSASSSEDDNIATGAGAGGRWYETITQKVNRIIDLALANRSADDEMRYLEALQVIYYCY